MHRQRHALQPGWQSSRTGLLGHPQCLGFALSARWPLVGNAGAISRGGPVWNCPDFLYEIKAGVWYGWPDFLGGLPINAPRYRSPDGVAQPFLLQNHAELPVPEKPFLAFEVNACATKMTCIPPSCQHAGDLIVAQFGDERPMTGPSVRKVGRNLVRVDIRDWSLHALPPLPFRRPLDVAFSPDAAFLYVVDFGEFEFTSKKEVTARAGSGCVWRIPTAEIEEMS